jgi:hypothetical protein
MSGSMESSASRDREVSEGAAADPFASAGGAMALLTRMSDDDESESIEPNLDENEDGLLDDPEAADDDEDALLDGDEELDGDLDDDDLDDDLDDELIDLDDEYDVDDDEDKPHPGSRFDE